VKQVLLKKGRAVVDEIPAPIASEDEVLVQVHYSCISAGTEIAGLQRTGATLARSALKKPQRILKALALIRSKGLKAAVARVNSLKDKEDAGVRTGYSASGVVLEVGENITDLKPGDRVACAGAGIADHAEFIAVPRNLLVRVPKDLPLTLASTVTLGSIAIQGVRRADPALGDNVAVIGLGILGQITAQLLRANGCRVIGMDLDSDRVEFARSQGLERGVSSAPQMVDEVISFTGGYGADVVIVTASTASSQVVNQAMKMCRRKGKVVVVGAVGMDLDRGDFYAKELDLLISTSYGPGRYDDEYELRGKDYPYGYVRWTENRNMEEYLRLLACKEVRIDTLIDKTYTIEDAPDAYRELDTAEQKPLIVLLEYHQEPPLERKVIVNQGKPRRDCLRVAVIGAGTFVQNTHLPNLSKLSRDYQVGAIVDKQGTNAKAVAARYGVAYATTDIEQVLQDDAVDVVLIGTRHNHHASIAARAARAGKAVLLEKPMALNQGELTSLVDVLEETKTPFMMGFNRRFSPCAKKIKEILAARQGPIVVNYQMNAGFLPPDHWTQGPEGGGRNIGEACHIYDLFAYLAESEVESVNACAITPPSKRFQRNDNFTASVKFEDGSVCNLVYTAMGHPDVSKERMEVYCENTIIQMDDYKGLAIFGPSATFPALRRSEKGHLEELQEFATHLREGNGQPIPLWQMIQATQISFEVEALLEKGGGDQ